MQEVYVLQTSWWKQVYNLRQITELSQGSFYKKLGRIISKSFCSSKMYHFIVPSFLFGEDSYDLCYQYMSIHPYFKKNGIKNKLWKRLRFKIVESYESIR